MSRLVSWLSILALACSATSGAGLSGPDRTPGVAVHFEEDPLLSANAFFRGAIPGTGVQVQLQAG